MGDVKAIGEVVRWSDGHGIEDLQCYKIGGY